MKTHHFQYHDGSFCDCTVQSVKGSVYTVQVNGTYFPDSTLFEAYLSDTNQGVTSNTLTVFMDNEYVAMDAVSCAMIEATIRIYLAELSEA